MRFMLLVKADKDSEAGVLPSKELLAAMGKYNEEMVRRASCSRARGSRRVPRAPGSRSLGASAPS
jgi:hypothetical protein